MSVLESILLGILQGIAEFLPISSSGHLQLAQALFGLEDVPLLYDVMLHLATLLAVVLFFWKKIWILLKYFGRMITGKKASEEIISEDVLTGSELNARKAIIAIILSTVVTGVLGIFSSKLIPELPLKFVFAGFIVTSVLLVISEILSKRKMNREPISIKQSLFIGFMQGIGTLPGISRSGSTISGALLSGVDREAAGEYSFIVSIPAILGAFILEAKDLGKVSSNIGALPVIAGCIAAFITGYFSLAFLMKLIKKGKLVWFAAYLIPLAILGFIFL